jgi:hypothetical protein
MNSNPETVKIEIIPTIFPDYNTKNNLPPDHKTTEITVARLKHGHLRQMQRLSKDDQIHYLMSELTGLSGLDLDELDADDSAKLTQVIFNFMARFAQMAQNMGGKPFNER